MTVRCPKPVGSYHANAQEQYRLVRTIGGPVWRSQLHSRSETQCGIHPSFFVNKHSALHSNPHILVSCWQQVDQNAQKCSRSCSFHEAHEQTGEIGHNHQERRRSKWVQPTDRHRNHNKALNQGRACRNQAVPGRLAALADNIARSVHATLTLCSSQAQFPMDTSEIQPRGASERARRSEIAQGTHVPCDGLAKVSLCLSTRRHKSLTGVHMTCVRAVLAVVAQSNSDADEVAS
jgi:hypothetical protein